MTEIVTVELPTFKKRWGWQRQIGKYLVTVSPDSLDYVAYLTVSYISGCGEEKALRKGLAMLPIKEITKTLIASRMHTGLEMGGLVAHAWAANACRNKGL